YHVIAGHWYCQHGPKPRIEGKLAERMIVRDCHISDLNRLTTFSGLADSRLSQINRCHMDCAKKFAAQVMAGNDIEGLTSRAKFKDSTAIGLREIHRIAGNRFKYLLQIQRRADRPAYVAEGAHLLKRKLKLARSLLDFFEQPHILNC